MSLKIFERQLRTTTVQLIMEQLNVFNAAGAGTITLGSGETLADTIETVRFGLIDSLISDRNQYAPVGTPAQIKVISELLTNRINGAGKVGPAAISVGLLEKINRDPAQVAADIATQASQGIIKRYVDASLGALVSAIGGQLDSTASAAAGKVKAIYTQVAPVLPNTPAGALVPTLADFERAATLFGDARSQLRAWYLSGAAYGQLLSEGTIQNAQRLMEIGNVIVNQDASGRIFIVTDNSYLGSDKVLGLTVGAAGVEASGVEAMAWENGMGENIERFWRQDFTYGIGLKGYRVTDAAIAAQKGKQSWTLADMVKAGNWTLDTGSTDQAPSSVDGVKETTGGGTGVNKRQADPVVPSINVKETAGVLLKLTASVQTAPNP